MKFGEDAACGLMSVAGSDVRPLFRPFGEAEESLCKTSASVGYGMTG